MNFVLYYFIILPISYLPYFFLYRLSNFVSFILNHILKYRKNVVINNLSNSFPHKNISEIEILTKKFYSHLSDLIIEALKGFTISEKNIRDRVVCENINLLEDLSNKSFILMGGHYNNWELSGQALPIYFKHDMYGIYKPLKNKFFDKKIKISRSKFGLKMVPMKFTKRIFLKDESQPKIIIFGSDQGPSNIKNAYWTNFLNQDTAFLQGAEKYAKEFNWPVIYGTALKYKRGYYKIKFNIISYNPRDTKDGEIIKKFSSLLEDDINNSPEFWLWSHRRWKRKRPYK